MYKVIPKTLIRDVSIRTQWPICSLNHQKRYTEDKSIREKYTKMSFLRNAWLQKFMVYFTKYQQTMEKKFPRMMHVFRVFSIGGKDLFFDVKKYIAIRQKLMKDGMDSLSRNELQLYYTVPKDMVKMLPVTIVSAVPFTNYIIFPLAYFLPKQLLTSHYWSLQQRAEFALQGHKQKLKHNKSLLRCMQEELQSIEDLALKNAWSDIIASLGSGTHSTTSDIIACSKLFMGPPYALSLLKGKHLRELLAIHGMSRWKPFRRRRLLKRGVLIKKMDTAIQREGGPKEMPIDALRWALLFRGLNPANMSTEDMQIWLNKWITVSSVVDENSISLLLHCPILLAYNQATNWTLLYH